MRELLYVPPGRPESSSAIGVLVPEFGNPIFAAFAEAMELHAAGEGLAMILCNTHGSAQRELDYVHMLLERRVRGMAFISAEITDVRGKHSHYGKLLDRGARLVFVNGGSDELEVTSVGVDERAAGRIATEYLIGLGHERIGFVAGHEFAVPTREKALGRRDALRSAGLTDGLIAHADFTVTGGRDAIRTLLSRNGDSPTGVICSSDLMAIGAVQEASAQGVRVPEELSVVGFDGIAAACLDAAAADDGRAADRRDRPYGSNRLDRAPSGPGATAAELRLQAASPRRRHDRPSSLIGSGRPAPRNAAQVVPSARRRG